MPSYSSEPLKYYTYWCKITNHDEKSENSAKLERCFNELLNILDRRGFLIAKDLKDHLDLEAENSYTFYYGDKDKYSDWIANEKNVMEMQFSYYNAELNKILAAREEFKKN